MPSGRRKPIIGLTGAIGAGKSSVARHLASLGAAVIDADALAREALTVPEVREQITQNWGKAALGPGGVPDRQRLADIVFDDLEQLRRLEDMIHPVVHRRREVLRRQYQADPAVLAIIEDMPLLLEKGLDKACDAVIFVHCPVQTRLRRLAEARGWAPGELQRREKCQLPLDFKAEQADYIIDNGTDESDCLSRVSDIFSQILQKFTA